MTQTYQNLKDFADEFVSKGGTKKELQRKIAAELGVSVNTAINWTCLDSRTSNQKMLEKLSEMTGIPQENLFRRH
ncbi:MAG: hypothetical protein PHH23_01520 [Paludibacteraceae bacterium]|nr:hypothetical protein [Paludibacteraceae bacterium]